MREFLSFRDFLGKYAEHQSIAPFFIWQYAWKLSLVGLACIPLTLSAGIVRLRVVNLKDEKVRKSHDVAAQTACEAAGAIRTVASLTREDDAVAIYSRALDGPMRVSNRIALVSNVRLICTKC